MRTFNLAVGDVITYNYYDEIRTNTICGANSEEFLLDDTAETFKTLHRNWTKNIIKINDNVVDKEDVVLCSNLTPDFHILTTYNDILVLKDGTVIEDGYHFSPWAKEVTIAYDSGDYEYGDEYNVVYYKCGLQDIISIDGVKVTQPIKIKNRSI